MNNNIIYEMKFNLIIYNKIIIKDDITNNFIKLFY